MKQLEELSLIAREKAAIKEKTFLGVAFSFSSVYIFTCVDNATGVLLCLLTLLFGLLSFFFDWLSDEFYIHYSEKAIKEHKTTEIVNMHNKWINRISVICFVLCCISFVSTFCYKIIVMLYG